MPELVILAEFQMKSAGPKYRPVNRTRGEIEAETTQCVLSVLKEVIGRGPDDAQTHLCDTLLAVRLHFPLHPMEKAMLQANEPKGLTAVRNWRRDLYEACRNKLVAAVSAVTQVPIRTLYVDSSPADEESMLVFTLESPLDLRVSPEKS